MQQQSPIPHVLYQDLDGLIPKFLLWFMNSEYVCAAEHVSQVCIDNSEKYLPLHEVFVGHNTLSYFEEEDGLSSEDVKKFNLGILSKLGGLLQPRELSNDYL